MHNEHPSKTWLERIGHALTRPKNRTELLEWLQEAADHDLIENEELLMIEGVLQVYDMQVRDIMTPRSQMVVLEMDASLAEILPIVISSAHSRFPVIKATRDEVAGILLAKDLLRYTSNSETPFDMQKLLRPVVFIPESKRLNILLEEFRLNRNHLAIVVDEYGGVAGMLTIEDVLEEIVGEIEDEYDIDEGQTDIQSISATQFNVKALTTIEAFNAFFHTKFSDAEFDTIGGLVTNHFGYLPKRDETVTIDNITCKVLHADKRRIRLLQITLPQALSPENP